MLGDFLDSFVGRGGQNRFSGNGVVEVVLVLYLLSLVFPVDVRVPSHLVEVDPVTALFGDDVCVLVGLRREFFNLRLIVSIQ